MIDTHTHLYMSDYENGGKDVVEKSLAAGVKHFILPNVDADSIEPMKQLHKLFPDVTSISIGLHPTEVRENWEEMVAIMERELLSDNYRAFGEIGMDLYWDKSTLEIQRKAFERQLKIADYNQLPVVIHCRDAVEETIKIIEKVKPKSTLVFHSFTGNSEDVGKIRSVCDPYFGINGVITFKNAESLREALPMIGLDRIVLETDAPFLAPMPYRGKRNESSYLYLICNKVAETLGCSPAHVENITDLNANRIFNLE